ncbi:hypothetical protein K1719_019794 [Acacia pycnantha]|nr:hypothetical protein K1719_019794 [Acacia pycnantha]
MKQLKYTHCKIVPVDVRYQRLALEDSSLMAATATIKLDGVVRDLSAVTDSDLEKRSLQMKGLNLMDKTFFVEGTRISFSIWDVAVRQESGIR